jgi:hypothetical protein
MHSRTAHRTERIPLTNWLVGLFIYGPDVRVGGARFAPGPVDGAFSLSAPVPSGYVWTYLGEGTDFCDAPDLVVVVPGSFRIECRQYRRHEVGGWRRPKIQTEIPFTCPGA